MKKQTARHRLPCLITLFLLAALLSGCAQSPKNGSFETATPSGTDSNPHTVTGTPSERFPNRPNADTKTGTRKELQKGDVAPEFTVTLLDGTTFRMSDYDDETVLLNFWATWCGPCVKEMPGLQQLADDGIEGFRVICVSVDDTNEEVEQFRKGSSLKPSLLAAAKGTAIPAYYPSDYIPYTVLVKNGVIQEVFVGSRSYKDYRDAVDAVISAR